jgi:transposase-like protein
MRIVGAEVAVVEAELVGGLLGCPSCREVLGPWGHARERVLRCASGDRRIRPRRARCRGCRRTHVLLPRTVLVRRQDEIAVIGAAIEAKVLAGQGFRRIADRLGASAITVRGWLRRFARRAELIRVHFVRCAVALDPELAPVLPAGSGVADALEAIAVAVRAWVLRFGLADRWLVVSWLSGGLLLQHEPTLGGLVVS